MHVDEEGFVHLPPTSCPYCGAVIDCTVSADERPLVPKDGDVSLCFQCVQPCIYVISGQGVSVRKPTPEERAEIIAQNHDTIATIVQFNLTHPKGDA